VLAASYFLVLVLLRFVVFMAEFTVPEVPSIEISLAPPEDPVVEPYSPFSTCTSPTLNDDDDTFRPQHLTPPVTDTNFPRQLSPLRPSETVKGKGLERDRFEALLRASKERNSAVGSKKTIDLRKEVALKAHKNKQVERRALFLSKVLAPPSPTATLTPKTPPESPAIFHYSLPSPGLVSPLALFESLEDPSRDPDGNTREAWVEQVDFRLPLHLKEEKEKPNDQTPFVKSLPSLDQISARLSSQGHVSIPPGPAEGAAGHRSRLPPFLAKRKTTTTDAAERPRLYIGVGRLQIPVRRSKPIEAEKKSLPPPKSPMSLLPKLQITTTLVPRTTNTSPTKLSESNLQALDSRERRARNMVSTLRRRTVPSDLGLTGHEIGGRKMKWKRHSAPAELTSRGRGSGFEHQVLALPGGF